MGIMSLFSGFWWHFEHLNGRLIDGCKEEKDREEAEVIGAFGNCRADDRG